MDAQRKGYSSAARRIARKRFVERHVRPRESDVILDIGCGTADIPEYLPASTRYVGMDMSESYVAAARRRWGTRGTFRVDLAEEIETVAYPARVVHRPGEPAHMLQSGMICVALITRLHAIEAYSP